MAGPLRPNPPPTSSLMPIGKLERWKKTGSKKSYFFLNGPAFTPYPLLMARPLREELFFAASLRKYFKKPD